MSDYRFSTQTCFAKKNIVHGYPVWVSLSFQYFSQCVCLTHVYLYCTYSNQHLYKYIVDISISLFLNILVLAMFTCSFELYWFIRGLSVVLIVKLMVPAQGGCSPKSVLLYSRMVVLALSVLMSLQYVLRGPAQSPDVSPVGTQRPSPESSWYSSRVAMVLSVLMSLQYGSQRPGPESWWYSNRVVTASLTSRAEMWYLRIENEMTFQLF